MTNPPHCNTSLSAGTFIMAGTAITNTERVIIVTRESNSAILNSGDSYVPGEVLSVQLSDTSGEYAFGASLGTFAGGGCSGSRVSTNTGVAGMLTMPASGSGNVDIAAGWAIQHGIVTITNYFTLVEQKATAALPPIKKSTHKPSSAYSAASNSKGSSPVTPETT